MLAAYLMKTEGMSFDAVRDLLRSKRALVKLEDRHRRVLESWVAHRAGEPIPGDEHRRLNGLGAGDGVRTRDMQLGRLPLCQLSYSRVPRTLPRRSPCAEGHARPLARSVRQPIAVEFD